MRTILRERRRLILLALGVGLGVVLGEKIPSMLGLNVGGPPAETLGRELGGLLGATLGLAVSGTFSRMSRRDAVLSVGILLAIALVGVLGGLYGWNVGGEAGIETGWIVGILMMTVTALSGLWLFRRRHPAQAS